MQIIRQGKNVDRHKRRVEVRFIGDVQDDECRFHVKKGQILENHTKDRGSSCSMSSKVVSPRTFEDIVARFKAGPDF